MEGVSIEHIKENCETIGDIKELAKEGKNFFKFEELKERLEN